MLKRKNFSDKDVHEMKHLMQTEKDLALRRKYHAIYLHMLGKSNKEIAEILARSEITIGKYIHEYYEYGRTGLVPHKQEGRPPLLNSNQKNELYQVITEKAPQDAGFKCSSEWTAELAAKLVSRKFGISFSNSGMLRILHQMKIK